MNKGDRNAGIVERSAGFVAYRVIAMNGPSVPRVEYLLLDYGRHWDFPKGHVEAGEDDLATAVRELMEETGLTPVQIAPDFHKEIVYYFRDRRKRLIRKSVVYFLAEMAGGAVRLSDEHVASVFLPFEEAVRRATFPTARELIRGAEAHLSNSTPPKPEPPATQ